MVKFTRCEIDERGESLIIEASVDNMSYYDDVYIDSIKIDTEHTYSVNGPSELSHEISFADEDGNYTRKSVSLRLCVSDIPNIDNFNESIFFVYVYATGIPCSTTPCGMDPCYVMTIAVNMRPIYNMAMKYINELNENCNVPRGFIDMFLRLKAFSLALRTGNIQRAKDLWKTVFKDKRNVSFKGCGCHGISG